MRKIFTVLTATLFTGSLFAGGLVTNMNQSASWVRLPARDASTDIDAVFYNPAGLMKLQNGFHFSISNQTIFQNKEVENFYKGPGEAYGLNQNLYKGKVKAPVFPGLYAAYKRDRFAFSLGFNPIGGGGGAVFDKGLPSFEMTPSDLVPSLASAVGATDYKVDTYFEGTSIYFGLQGGVSYKINEFISVAAGIRYVMAKNTYNGYLKNLEIYTGNSSTPAWTRADAIMTGIAAKAATAAASTTSMVTGGLGGLTFAQAESAGYISSLQKAQLEGALGAFGSPSNITINQADVVFKGASAKYLATASLLGDQEADVEQTGSGITPFISVNISPSENLNIAVKYEMGTKIELENKTEKDFTTGYNPTTGAPVTMFPDGEKIRNDMPALIAVGIKYGVTSRLELSAGAHYYFDKKANYGHKLNGIYVNNDLIIDRNYYELAGGLEYHINDMCLVSGGYLFSKTGVNNNYQSDLTYSLTSHTFGLGGAIDVLENLRINAGFSYSYYLDGEKTVAHTLGTTTYNPRETYFKDTTIFAIGVDLSF